MIALLAALMGLAACQSPTGAGQATPAPPASPGPPVRLTAQSLTLTITAPADETVVTVPQVDVVGEAPAESVISVNDNVVVVNATGQFSTTVALQDGPNEIDIVASDTEGNQTSTRLIVTYDAPG